MIESRLLRVFLSHTSEDKLRATEFHKRLQNEGWIDPWLDKVKILPGQAWNVVIEEAVEKSDVVVVFLSNYSVTKEGFIQKELRYAVSVAQEKPDNTIFLVPVKLEECPIPRPLKSYHWVNYFSDEKEDAYKSLLESFSVRYNQVLEYEEKERIQRKNEDEERKKGGDKERRFDESSVQEQDANKFREDLERYKMEESERKKEWEKEQQKKYEQTRKELKNQALKSNVAYALMIVLALLYIRQNFFSMGLSEGSTPTNLPSLTTSLPNTTPISTPVIVTPTSTPSYSLTIAISPTPTKITNLTQIPSNTAAATSTPLLVTEKPILIAPTDGGALPQPLLPNQWIFVWQADSNPCHSIITIDGPDGQLLSDSVYVSTGRLYKYVYSQTAAIPDNRLKSWSWRVDVICPFLQNTSEKSEFSVGRPPFDWERFSQNVGNILALLGVLFTTIYVLGLLPFLLYFEQTAHILEKNPAITKLLGNLEYFNWMDVIFKFIEIYQSNKIKKESEPVKQRERLYSELDEISNEMKLAIDNEDAEKMKLFAKRSEDLLGQIKENNHKLNQLMIDLRIKYDERYNKLKILRSA